jgi:hypothetical protein
MAFQLKINIFVKKYSNLCSQGNRLRVSAENGRGDTGHDHLVLDCPRCER